MRDDWFSPRTPDDTRYCGVELFHTLHGPGPKVDRMMCQIIDEYVNPLEMELEDELSV